MTTQASTALHLDLCEVAGVGSEAANASRPLSSAAIFADDETSWGDPSNASEDSISVTATQDLRIRQPIDFPYARYTAPTNAVPLDPAHHPRYAAVLNNVQSALGTIESTAPPEGLGHSRALHILDHVADYKESLDSLAVRLNQGVFTTDEYERALNALGRFWSTISPWRRIDTTCQREWKTVHSLFLDLDAISPNWREQPDTLSKLKEYLDNTLCGIGCCL